MGRRVALKLGDDFGGRELGCEPIEGKTYDGTAGGVSAGLGGAAGITDRFKVGVSIFVEVDRNLVELGASIHLRPGSRPRHSGGSYNYLF